MSTETDRTAGRTTTPSAADRLRREWYLMRFSWAMEDYPRRTFRRIRTELRGELTAAAADVGMRQATADLGPPVVLAERYIAELGRRLPRYTTGAAAAGLAVGLLLYLALAYSLGTMSTLEALGGGSVTTYPFGAETTFTHTAAEISMTSSASWQATVFVVGLATVAFVLGSRLWRVLG